MEAYQVTKENLHLAVAALLTNQSALTKQLNSQDLVLLDIRTQTIKTNGRVLAAEAAILECKAGVKDALAKACPGNCILLAEKVRSLEDSRLEATATLGGMKWIITAAAAAGGVVTAGVNWIFSKP